MISLWAAGAVGAVMLALWGISVLRRDASIVDLFWGPGFALIVWVVWVEDDAVATVPRLWLPVLVSVWAARLGVYLTVRNWGEPEDRRYAAIRARNQPFWLKSLPIVFGLQGALMWGIALPLQFARSHAPLGALAWVGGGVFAFGWVFEAVADAQLARFKRDPDSRGQTLQRGLWGLCRHPNYFGEIVLWWGLFLVALDRGAPAWTALGPATLTVFILRVSGIPLLEPHLARNPDHSAYRARVPALIPRVSNLWR